MMGQERGFQPKLFYHQMNLEQRVPPNHTLKKIQERIDFDFIYGEVKDTYGDNGNVSIPPPVILKMMLLLTLYNVRSERELMDTIPLRLDWLWFLGYDLESEVPNHSVLSKARYGEQTKKCLSVLVNQVKGPIPRVIRSVSDRMKGLMISEMNRFISTGFISTIYIEG